MDVHRKICDVYGDDALTKRVCQKWFARFRSGNFDVEDRPRTGRPTEADNQEIKALVNANPKITTREIANSLNISQPTVVRRLKKIGYVSRLNVWVPHVLTEEQLTKRISFCDMLKKRNEIDPFLSRIVTGDEKWVLYENVDRQRSWGPRGEPPPTTPKAGLHPRKVLLSIWWDRKGVIYYELLPEGKTIDSKVYCQQLTKLNLAIKNKRPELANRRGVMFHHDNATPHTSLKTRNKLLRLGWDVLPHPPYSPDLAPSDYHLFRSLQNSLNGKSFAHVEAIKLHLDQFFNNKTQAFYEQGIMNMPERWQKVIDNVGKYITD